MFTFACRIDLTTETPIMLKTKTSMKITRFNFSLILLSLLSTGLHAQERPAKAAEPAQTDSTEQVMIIDIARPDTFNYWEERFKGNWAGIFVSINGVDRSDYSMYPPSADGFLEPRLWRSNCLSINLLQLSVRLQKNRNFVGLVTGLGMDLKSYSLSPGTTLRKGPQRVEPVQLSYEENQKSKFSSNYLTVPLLFEMQIPIGSYHRRAYISAGVIGSLRLSSHTKVKYRVDNKRQKLKTPGDFYLADTGLSATVRAGYRWINLFATYDLQPLFDHGRGPVLYPFSVGVGLIKF